jgi:hypothetical protein
MVLSTGTADKDSNGRPLTLLPQHRLDLCASGLNDATIEACGFISTDNPDVIGRLLNWRSPADGLGPCLVIPFRRPDGSPIPIADFCRLKPDRPRTQDGSTVKYEQPAGKSLRAFFPPGTTAALFDPSQPLIITEGEKKAAKADQEGFPCVGLTGVDCWGKDGAMIADLAAVAWRGRTVYIVYDSDAASKPAVRGAEERLAQALMGCGAVVKVVRLPLSPGVKVGLDDFLVAHGPDALHGLLTASVQSVGGKNRYRPLPAFRSFPLKSLPPVLCELVPAAAEGIGCDPALIALPALAVAAGCIGNARALVLKKGWIESAVVWALTVAESGGHKSPAYRAAVQPLTDLQLDLFEQYQQRKKDHKKELEDYATLAYELKRKKQALTGLVKPPAPEEPPAHITSDSTIEALGVLLGANPHGLLFARDELDAWFQSFTRYKGGRGGGTDRPQWLELHAAGTLILHRLTREQRCLSVRRAAVSVTGTIQPAVLADALDRDALQAGLGSRFLLAMPPRRPRVWTEADLPDQIAADYRRLLMDLFGLPLADTVKRKPYYLGLSNAARRLWIEFFNEWGQVQHDAEGEQASAFAKIEAYGARLMLLHHVISEVVAGGPRAPLGDGGSLPPVTEASARAGIELARWFAAEAVRVYAMLRESQEERETRRLVEWIAEHGGRVTVRQLQKSNHHKWPSSPLAEIALDALVQAGLGRWEEAPARAGGERETKWFVLTLQTSDTSDTSWGEAEAASDTSSDTCQSAPTTGGLSLAGNGCPDEVSAEPPSGGKGEVSEVSDVCGGDAAAERPGPGAEVSEEVSEGHGDAWEPPASPSPPRPAPEPTVRYTDDLREEHTF